MYDDCDGYRISHFLKAHLPIYGKCAFKSHLQGGPIPTDSEDIIFFDSQKQAQVTEHFPTSRLRICTSQIFFCYTLGALAIFSREEAYILFVKYISEKEINLCKRMCLKN